MQILASGGAKSLAHYDYSGVCLGTTELAGVDMLLALAQRPSCEEVDRKGKIMNLLQRLYAVAGLGDTIDLLQSPLCLSATLHVP